MAARGHQTLRFESFEQNQRFAISDDEVLREYWRECKEADWETRPDHGLTMLTSMCDWRKNGWQIADKLYKIHAFVQVKPILDYECKVGVRFLNGLYVGLQLPVSAQYQPKANDETWDVSFSHNAAAGSWIGHCVYIVAYDAHYLTCVTWGMRRKMTWAFFQKYCDEAYAIVDDRDAWLPESPVNINKLDKILDVNKLKELLEQATQETARA